MRAIRANLPNFGRHQIRQLAWVKGLDNRIERVESGIEKIQSIPKAGPARLGNSSFLNTSTNKVFSPPIDLKKGRLGLLTSLSPPPPKNVQLLSAINDKHFNLKKVSFLEGINR